MIFEQLYVDRPFEGLWEGPLLRKKTKGRGADGRCTSRFEDNWLWDQDTLRSTSSNAEHVKEVTKIHALDEKLHFKLTAKLPTISETWRGDSYVVGMGLP